MNVLIVEDEEPAANRIIKLLVEIDPSLNILGVIDSINSGIKWFNDNKIPDFVVADIQLADGLSFELFSAIENDFPIIFTTAYDEYAITAFKFNGLDYLLKPIRKEELSTSLEKVKKNFNSFKDANNSLLKAFFKDHKEPYQKRIIIRYRDELILLDLNEVSYFFVENRVTYCTTQKNQTFPVEFTLDECETMLNPALFYRINRQFIIQLQAIKKMTTYSKSRLSITLEPQSKHETIVSTERASGFKTWLVGK